MMMVFLFLLLFFFVDKYNFVNKHIKKEWGELSCRPDFQRSIACISPHSFKLGYKGPNRILSLTY
jgi:hypothetical protein